MLLNLKQVQALDLILNILNSRYSYSSNPLKLVVKINDSLWKGNFVNFSSDDYYLHQEYINSFGFIVNQSLEFEDVITQLSNLKLNKYKNIKPSNLHLLLIDLVNIIKDLDTSKIKLNLHSILYNAVKLDCNISLPFIILDDDSTFEVISIVESN